MGYFTEELLEEIKQYILATGTKDTDLPSVSNVSSNDEIVIVLNGYNKKINLRTLFSSFGGILKELDSILDSVSNTNIDIENLRVDNTTLRGILQEFLNSFSTFKTTTEDKFTIVDKGLISKVDETSLLNNLKIKNNLFTYGHNIIGRVRVPPKENDKGINYYETYNDLPDHTKLYLHLCMSDEYYADNIVLDEHITDVILDLESMYDLDKLTDDRYALYINIPYSISKAPVLGVTPFLVNLLKEKVVLSPWDSTYVIYESLDNKLTTLGDLHDYTVYEDILIPGYQYSIKIEWGTNLTDVCESNPQDRFYWVLRVKQEKPLNPCKATLTT